MIGNLHSSNGSSEQPSRMRLSTGDCPIFARCVDLANLDGDGPKQSRAGRTWSGIHRITQECDLGSRPTCTK